MGWASIDPVILRQIPLPFYSALELGVWNSAGTPSSINPGRRYVAFSNQQSVDIEITAIGAMFDSATSDVQVTVGIADDCLPITASPAPSGALFGFPVNGDYLRRLEKPLLLKAGQQLYFQTLSLETATVLTGRVTLVGRRLPHANS